MSFDKFPKKCIKCEKSDGELHKFTYAILKGGRTLSISFPVCSICKPKFDRTYKIETAFRSIRRYFIISGIVAIFIIVLIISGITFILFDSILTVTIGLSIIGLIFYLILAVNPYRIKNFIVLKKSGEFRIKNTAYQQEFVEQVIKEEVEKAEKVRTGVGMIFCPKCGSKQIKGIDFCNNCGKELRNL